MKKKVLIILASLLGFLLLAFVLVGIYMVDYSLTPSDHLKGYDGSREKVLRRNPEIVAWHDSLRAAGVLRDTCITGYGGYILHAVYCPAMNPADAGGTALLIHGYTDSYFGMLEIARMYRDSLNFNFLAPDLHFHGMSEGRAVRMGWLDRLDARRWGELAHDIWKDDFLVVHGVSMGAATTMMLSGETLPSYFSAFIEDCGYSDVWHQFAHNLKDIFGLPPFPVLHSADIICRLRYGWGFRQASSVKQLAKSTKPMLFIHGGDDDFVPTADVYVNYAAKTHGLKRIWIAPGSGHATSYRDYPAQYTAQVRSFLEEVKGL